MMDPPADPNGQLVLRFMMGTAEGKLDEVADLVTDDFTMVWPQSGETFSGRDKAFGAMRAQRDMPQPIGPPRLVGSGDVWVLMMPLRYADGRMYHYTSVLELENGRIKRGTGTWAAPFEAQEYRAEFADSD